MTNYEIPGIIANIYNNKLYEKDEFIIQKELNKSNLIKYFKLYENVKSIGFNNDIFSAYNVNTKDIVIIKIILNSINYTNEIFLNKKSNLILYTSYLYNKGNKLHYIVYKNVNINDINEINWEKQTIIIPTLFNIFQPLGINLFLLAEVVGTGRFSYIFKGFYLGSNKYVAVKLLKDTDDKMFNREVTTLEYIKNIKGVIHIIDYVTINNSINVIVTEYLEQTNLSLKLTDYINICLKLSKTLNILHEKKVVHSDIKPENIIITGDLEPHILDFGISFIDYEINDLELKPKGTPIYMAPEALNKKINNEKIIVNDIINNYVFNRYLQEIYSLGLTFSELIYDQSPVVHKNLVTEYDLYNAILEINDEHYDFIYPEEMKYLIMDMTNKNPLNRPRLPEIIKILEDMLKLYSNN